MNRSCYFIYRWGSQGLETFIQWIHEKLSTLVPKLCPVFERICRLSNPLLCSLGWKVLWFCELKIEKGLCIMGNRWCHGRIVRYVWMLFSSDVLVCNERLTLCVLLLEWYQKKKHPSCRRQGQARSHLAEYLSYDRCLPLQWLLHSPTPMVDISNFPMNKDTAMELFKNWFHLQFGLLMFEMKLVCPFL